MHLKTLGELRQRAVATNGGEGYLRFEQGNYGFCVFALPGV